MVGTQFEKVLDNLKVLIRERDAYAARFGHRARITLQLTFLETNTPEFAAIVRLAAELGVDRVKGHHLWAHFSQIKGLAMRRSPDSIARWNSAVREAEAAAEQHRLPNGAKVLLENIAELTEGAIGDMAPGSRCPFLGQEAWVSAEGRFNPCCAPDKERQTLGNFGSLNSSSITDIWDGSAYQQLREDYATRALCKGCNMRQPEKKP
jgi:MoaA/NifB/PqqE/SkfB family radical SAM enzyme